MHFQVKIWVILLWITQFAHPRKKEECLGGWERGKWYSVGIKPCFWDFLKLFSVCFCIICYFLCFSCSVTVGKHHIFVVIDTLFLWGLKGRYNWLTAVEIVKGLGRLERQIWYYAFFMHFPSFIIILAIWSRFCCNLAMKVHCLFHTCYSIVIGHMSDGENVIGSWIWRGCI